RTGWDILYVFPSRDEREGAKDAPHPATLFDFRGAGFDTTRRGPDGTYFMYFPVGMSEKGRKMPPKIEKR
ncbi:MAG TPA: hypothetical protein DGC56_00050, partial [Alistipes putredinis]|nr:hypothetical protein [Alistipes putredinis]